MNPWDMVKAIGRAARWLFSGRKKRHLDVSYDLSRKTTQSSGVPPPALSTNTAYQGPAGTGRYDGAGDESHNLLANQQSMGMSRNDHSPYRGPSPYRTETQETNGAAQGDIGVATSSFDDQPHFQREYQQQYGHAPQYQQQQIGVVRTDYGEGTRGRQTKEVPYFPPPPKQRQDGMF